VAEWLKAARRSLGILASTALSSIWKWRAELLVAFAALAGWFALTWVIVDVIGHATRVWVVSLGLLAFSLVGWRFLWDIITTGLYPLTRAKPEKPNSG
jgi:hypothetical protein